MNRLPLTFISLKQLPHICCFSFLKMYIQFEYISNRTTVYRKSVAGFLKKKYAFIILWHFSITTTQCFSCSIWTLILKHWMVIFLVATNVKQRDSWKHVILNDLLFSFHFAYGIIIRTVYIFSYWFIIPQQNYSNK